MRNHFIDCLEPAAAKNRDNLLVLIDKREIGTDHALVLILNVYYCASGGGAWLEQPSVAKSYRHEHRLGDDVRACKKSEQAMKARIQTGGLKSKRRLVSRLGEQNDQSGSAKAIDRFQVLK